MKITFIGHAAILIEAAGLSILSDPWWRGPCFGSQWWNYPAPHLDPLKDRKIDYIYISHGHHDHFHPGTLGTLSKDATVLVSSQIGLAFSLRQQGFNVIEVDEDCPAQLGDTPVSCRIMRTHGDDTLMILSDGTEVCVNLNDALHSAPDDVQAHYIGKLKQLHEKIDYVFCGYGAASHFPNCYVIPGKDRNATASRRQRYFNNQWAKIIGKLSPVFGFPFAADVVFLEDDLMWVNEPTHNSQRPTAAFDTRHPASPVTVSDIAPGFTIDDGIVTAPVTRQRLMEASIKLACAQQIARANRLGSVTRTSVEEVNPPNVERPSSSAKTSDASGPIAVPPYSTG